MVEYYTDFANFEQGTPGAQLRIFSNVGQIWITCMTMSGTEELSKQKDTATNYVSTHRVGMCGLIVLVLFAVLRSRRSSVEVVSGADVQ